MQLRALIISFCLLFGHTFTAMEQDTSADLEKNSLSTPMPSEIIAKLLWVDKTVRQNTVLACLKTLLALQQTCQYWNTSLNPKNKKEIIGMVFFHGKQFNENDEADFTLGTLDDHKRLQQCLGEGKIDLITFLQKTAPELYLFAGANPNYVNPLGSNSLLMTAATRRDNDTLSAKYIKMLLTMKADPNFQGNGGNTALHLAVQTNATHCVEQLLLANAKINLKNSAGIVPARYTYYESGYPKINRYRKQILSKLKKALVKAAIPELEFFDGRHEAHAQRIRQLLEGTITVEKSIANPLPPVPLLVIQHGEFIKLTKQPDHPIDHSFIQSQD